ncbi:transporter substrate-binding domain-containing protein [Stappia albiluteola]|nr:transporter substrate-binding domain-containing protein [Stappia albiluteola]
MPVPPNFWDPRATAENAGVTPEAIQFLATDDFPPFAFRDSTGRLTGFNIDLARAVCEELKIACSLRVKSFDALIPALMREEGDAIIAGLRPTEANLKTLRFSDDYLGLPARFVAGRGARIDATPEGLDGQAISVVGGTLHEAFLKRFFPRSQLVVFETTEEARDAVRTGAVTAHFGDALSLSFWLNGELSADCCAFAGGPWLEPGYFDRGLAVAFRADDELRQQALDYALRRLQQKGTYSELYLRYFPISYY